MYKLKPITINCIDRGGSVKKIYILKPEKTRGGADVEAGADLIDADLIDADLIDAGADADLIDANLIDADLIDVGADLIETDASADLIEMDADLADSVDDIMQDSKLIAPAKSVSASAASTKLASASAASIKLASASASSTSHKTELPMNVYNVDTVLRFKEKVFVATGVPVFRQHLCISGSHKPLAYTADRKKRSIPLNYTDIFSFKHNISGIPIGDSSFSDVFITGYDLTAQMGEYQNVFDMLDINEFMPSLSQMGGLLRESNKINLIYWNFVRPYWPIISIHIFSEMLSGKVPVYKSINSTPDVVKKNINDEEQFLNKQMAFLAGAEHKKLQQFLKINITHSVLSVEGRSSLNDIDLVMLFDKYILSSAYPWSKLVLPHRKLFFVKSYEGYQITNSPNPKYSLTIVLNGANSVELILYPDASYHVKTTWFEQNKYKFGEIIKIAAENVNPVLKQINLILGKVGFRLMTEANAKIAESDVSIFYNMPMSVEKFQTINTIMQKLQDVGYFEGKVTAGTVLEYYFLRGKINMGRFISSVDEIQNTYGVLTEKYLSDKWNILFKRMRHTKITHRFSGVRIDISNVSRPEFGAFMDILSTVLFMQSKIKESKRISSGNTIQHLKMTDPVLYEFKKLHGSPSIYSKKCQKSYQPTIIENSVAIATKDRTLVKYWNFTNNEPAYYKCPNPKFPNLKFLIKVHPLDYCIPCCKKNVAGQTKKTEKKSVHDRCMSDHKFSGEKKIITQGSRYVMMFGKDIEPGRISRLPESSLEMLFSESYSVKGILDKTCDLGDDYYLYGVPQSYRYVQNVGCLYCIAHATDKSVNELLDYFLMELGKNEYAFYSMLGGISKYFYNLDDFVSVYRMIFYTEEIIPHRYLLVPWNDIFINLCVFLKLNVNIFFSYENTVLMQSKKGSTVKHMFLYETNLLLLKKDNLYYPIYLINKDNFFKSKLIQIKLFSSGNFVIQNLKNIYGKVIETPDKLSYGAVDQFAADMKLEITLIYVNPDGLAYALIVMFKGEKIYVPIIPSAYGGEISYRPPTKGSNAKKVLDFVAAYNKWVDSAVEKKDIIPNVVIHPYIKFIKTVNCGGKRIAFMDSSRHLWYVYGHGGNGGGNERNPEGETGSVIELPYNPMQVNAAIFDKLYGGLKPKMAAKSSDAASVCLYEYNLYKMFLKQISDAIYAKRNVALRSAILQNLSNDKKLSEILTDKDYMEIKVIADDANFRTLFEAHFDFDFPQIGDTYPKVYAFLEQLAAKSMVIVSPADEKKITLQTAYSPKSKLKITKAKMDDYLDILTADFLLPHKGILIFEKSYLDSCSNSRDLTFVKRPEETIDIYATKSFD